MVKFTPQKIDLATINEGNRYGFEGIHPEAINAPIEASAYAQEIAESVKGLALNQPDSSQADNVGTPTVEISGTGENAKFVFKNLKGEQGLTGPSGVASGTVNSNEHGTSQTNGYTQYAVNTLVSNPNLLINSDFVINQRGQTEYQNTSSIGIIGVDCWQIGIGASIKAVKSAVNSVGVTVSKSATSIAGYYLLSQSVEDYAKLAGKTLTVTVAYQNNTNGFRIQCNDGIASHNSSAFTSASGVVSNTFTVNSTPTRFQVRIQDQSASAMSIELLYVKLEVGSVATAYTPPIYEEELLKCRESSFNEYYNSSRVESNNFPTSSAQTSELKFFSEKAVYDNFLLRSDPNGLTCLNITANANLNDCIPSKAGQIQFWTASTIGIVQTLANAPTLNETFYMVSQKQWIDTQNASATRETQMAVTMSGAIYTRGKGDIGGTATSWSNWKEISIPTEWQTFDSITDDGRTFTLPSYGTYEIKIFYNSKYYIFRTTYSNDTDYYETVMGELKNSTGETTYTIAKSGNWAYGNNKIYIYSTGAQDITNVLGSSALANTLYRRVSD